MHFLENIGFLNVNACMPHKYSVIRIETYKKAATGVTAYRAKHYFVNKSMMSLERFTNLDMASVESG